MNTSTLVKVSLVAGIYTVVSLLIAPISYGIVQFRIAEILNLLAFIDPYYIIGVTLGCFITNVLGPVGLPDIVFGTTATFLATVCIYKSKNLIIASLYPTIFTPIVGLELYLFFDNAFWIGTLSIMLSQFIICTILGVPLYKILFKNKNFVEVLRIDKNNNNIYNKIK